MCGSVPNIPKKKGKLSQTEAMVIVMKKTVSLCILTGLLLAVLSACGAKTEEIVPEYSADVGGVMDLNGKEYIIRDTVHHGDTPLIPTSMENALDDMLLEHYEQTEIISCYSLLQ